MVGCTEQRVWILIVAALLYRVRKRDMKVGGTPLARNPGIQNTMVQTIPDATVERKSSTYPMENIGAVPDHCGLFISLFPTELYPRPSEGYASSTT